MGRGHVREIVDVKVLIGTVWLPLDATPQRAQPRRDAVVLCVQCPVQRRPPCLRKNQRQRLPAGGSRQAKVEARHQKWRHASARGRRDAAGPACGRGERVASAEGSAWLRGAGFSGSGAEAAAHRRGPRESRLGRRGGGAWAGAAGEQGRAQRRRRRWGVGEGQGQAGPGAGWPGPYLQSRRSGGRLWRQPAAAPPPCLAGLAISRLHHPRPERPTPERCCHENTRVLHLVASGTLVGDTMVRTEHPTSEPNTLYHSTHGSMAYLGP